MGFNEDKYMNFKVICGKKTIQIGNEELKQKLKKDLATNTHLSVFLGSGCSTKAIPLMGTTFKKFKNEKENDTYFNDIYKRFCSKNPKDKSNIESFLSWIGSGIEFSSDSQLKDIKDKLTSELIESVKAPFDDYGLVKETQDENSEEIKKTKDLYNKFVKSLSVIKSNLNDRFDIINIFTTNYDLFIERALDDLGFSYTDGFNRGLAYKFDVSEYSKRPVDTHNRFKDHWSTISPFFRVYKLHGSINWIRHQVSETKTEFIKTPNISNKKDEVLIAPTSSKYAETQGSPYSDLFRELSVKLLMPNSILLLNGFSFGDEHINELISQSLSRPDFKLIAFVDEKNDVTKDFIDRVGGNSRAIFITDGDNKNSEHAYYFSTLVDLLDSNNLFGSENQFDTTEKDESVPESKNDKN